MPKIRDYNDDVYVNSVRISFKYSVHYGPKVGMFWGVLPSEFSFSDLNDVELSTLRIRKTWK